MFDNYLFYKNSNSNSIVYRSVDGSFVDVSLDDFMLDNPCLLEEDFFEFKRLSDSLHYDAYIGDNIFHKNVIFDDFALNNVLNGSGCLSSCSSVGDESFLVEFLDVSISNGCPILTSVQHRRFIKYFVRHMSIGAIALDEAKFKSSIWESLHLSKKKLSRYFFN